MELRKALLLLFFACLIGTFVGCQEQVAEGDGGLTMKDTEAIEAAVQDGEELKEFVLRANDELLNKGNLDFADEVFAMDYGDRGPEGIKEMVTGLRTAFPDLHVTVGEFVAEGERVAWLRTHSGTHQGEFMGVPATGKAVTWRTMVISRIVDGKIVEEVGISDLREQLGQ